MQKKTALIIGNSEYQDSNLSRLAAPEVDVEALANVLRDPDIGSFHEVQTLIDKSLDIVRLSIARFFGRKKRNDLLLLYFSGHGILDETGRLYLALSNTDTEWLTATALPATYISEEMDRSRSKRQLLLLDCCHSGAFERGRKGATGVTVGTQTVFEGTGYGRVVITASDSTQYAWEGEKIIVGHTENSLFTHFLLEGLASGDADVDNDGLVTSDDLFEYIYEKVIEETPKQTPGKWAYKQQGNIAIAKNPVWKPKEQAQEQQTQVEVIEGVEAIPLDTNFVQRVWENPDGMIFREIPAGSFAMGATKYPDERPVHFVNFDTPFFMSETLITNSQYREFLRATRYRGKHKNFLLHLRNFFEKSWKHPNGPVAFISWQDAKEFILWLCELHNRDYRLPTEAQWEYACRSGTRTVYYWGNSYEEDMLNAGQRLKHPTPVKRYSPNPWGLYDMLGNLWEWTEDFKDVLPREESLFYRQCADLSVCVNPVNTDPNPIISTRVEKGLRVIKGGSWYSKTHNVRPANRRGQRPSECIRSVGFRLVCVDVPLPS